MSIATATLPSENRVLLSGVSWSTYEALLADTQTSGTKFTYDRGYLEIVPPSYEHERIKSLLGRMIEAATEELDIPICTGGSTTLKLELKQRGAEPDECYYVANESQMRGHENYDPMVDPPPDLVIEVDISRNSLSKFAIYADFGVPEIWTYEDDALHVYRLQDDGSYARQDHSSALPFLPLESIQGFLDRRNATDETTWIRSFRKWAGTLSRP
jgi:Uma2 family endonuclease